MLISAKNITKTFFVGDNKINALNDVSFDISEGEFIVILGPSGSGKSTLLNIIGGIETVTSGQIEYRDIKLHGASKSKLTAYRRNNIGFVFQFYNLMPCLTVAENIKLAEEISKNPIPANTLISKVGLSERANYYPSKLSGGQQQRVAIARAICKNPELLLCDEPTGALDIKTGAEVLQLIYNFNKQYKKTVIIITHNNSISQIADRIFYIKDSVIEKIVENPNSISPSEVKW